MYSADYDGVEIAQVRAVGHAPIKPNEMYGRMRSTRFTFNTGAGVTDGEAIVAAILPKGARVLRIFTAFEDMGGSAAVDVGLFGNDGSGYISADNSTTADDDDLFAAALDISSAGEATIADTIAQNYGYELEKECALVLTAESDDWAADKDIIGHVEYVVD